MSFNGSLAFDFDKGPTWKHDKTGVYSTEILYFDPVKKLGDDDVPGVDFELASDKWVMVGGPACGILVEGKFQFSEPNTNVWANCRADLIPHVTVCHNWFGNLIKEEAIFDGNSSIPLHSEAPYVGPMLDTYLMSHMHPDDKKFYCPEETNPANGCPTKLTNGWTQTADSEWRKYAATIFTGKKIKFIYKPLHNFMFFQGTNEFIDGQVNNALPFPFLENKKLVYRLNFHSHDRIFKREATKPDNKYRFSFDRIAVVMTVAKLSPNFDRQLSTFKKKNDLPYKGVTRIMMAENIPEGTTSFRCRFQQIYMPEQVVIFALHKNVINGTWTYEKDCYRDGQVFGEHNIKEVHLTFNNQPFYFSSPNFGQLLDPTMKLKSYNDYLLNPPFGLIQDGKLVSLDTELAELGHGTPYPIVYMPLTNSDKTRIRTVKPEVVPLDKRHDLDITVQFKVGATADVSYCFYAVYTDYNLKFTGGKFESYYVAS